MIKLAELLDLSKPMGAAELVAFMDESEFGAPELARILGATPKTVWRWVTERTDIPRPAAMAIRFVRKSLGSE